LIHARRLPWRAQFRTRGDHCHFKRFEHRNFAQTRSRHHSKLFWPELMTFLKNLRALLHVFASRTRISPSFERANNLELASLYLNVFLQDHRIGTLGQSCAGEDAQCLTGQELTCESLSSSRAPLPQFKTLRARLKTTRKSIAIHR
jgi:hypothetical protein